MKNRIFLAIFLSLMSLQSWAQIGGDYNPENPSDPQAQARQFQFSVVAEPEKTGSFNIEDLKVEAGCEFSLIAYNAKSDYVFKHWMLGDSILSTDDNLTFVMPSHNVQLIGVFEYNPANPANPGSNYWNSKIGEVIVDDFKPGDLYNAIYYALNGSSSQDVTMITVAGKMSSGDFGIANSYSNCTLLDLSRVTGITEVPSYAFDRTNLESVYLPASIERIGDRAFYNCSKLASLTIYAMTPPELGSNVFAGVPEDLTIYIPAAAIAQYQEDETWGKFTLLPIQEDIRSISVSLPAGANAQDYAQMWLELTNTKSGQRMHYIMTDRQKYSFANIIRNTSWIVTLRNERGDVFGQIENVEVLDEDVEVAFSSLSKPQNISLSVITPDGTDVTTKAQITWMDAKGNYLAQTTGLTAQPAGNTVSYKVTLAQELAMQYATPMPADHVVADGKNDVQVTLEPIKQVTLSGNVKDLATKTALNGAVVTASQTFAGKYSKTVSTKTDAKGNYTLTVSNVPTSLAVSVSDYISQTIVCDSLMTGRETITLSDVSLKGISGAVISLSLSYTQCPTEDSVEGAVQDWYADYNNVSYSIYNRTKQVAISQFNVQYPQIVLLEEVEEGDVLEMTATSKTGAFMPVKAIATIDAEQNGAAAFSIVELGKIKASFAHNSNPSVVGTLYDANGKLIKSYDYSGGSLTINDLVDGRYTLVSMGNSRLFSSIYDLSQLPQTGLVAGSDYTQASVMVSSGKLAVIDIDEVPTLDESKLYYTGDNTSFTVNKSSIVAGNYLTLTGHIDFKSAYSANVSNVNLIVDLPESCQFVENSVMVGNSTSSYTLQNNRITIPLARYTDRVRFCIIPTLGGDYAPSALAQFDLDGKTITQPIGSANYTAKDLSISVPSIVAKTTISVCGTAVGVCAIEIYDGDILIGHTNSLANGVWAANCELNSPYNLSAHQIYARATTKQGLFLISERKKCVFNKNAIFAQTVDMSYLNVLHDEQNTIHFDVEHQTCSVNSYYFSTGTDFTFTANLSNNDTTIVKGVTIGVYTDHKGWINLAAVYNSKIDRWVAVHRFDSSNLPIGVKVEIEADVNPEFDSAIIDDYNSYIQTLISEESMYPLIDSIQTAIYNELEKEQINEEVVDSLQNIIDSEMILSDETTEKIDKDFLFLFTKWREKTWCDGPPPSDRTGNIDDDVKDFYNYVDKYIEKNYVYNIPDNNISNPIDFIETISSGGELPTGVINVPQSNSLPGITYVRNSTDNSLSGLLRQEGVWIVTDNDTYTSKVELVNNKTGDVIIFNEENILPSPSFDTEGLRNFANSAINVVDSYGNNNEMQLLVDVVSEICDNYRENESAKYNLKSRLSSVLTREGSRQRASLLAENHLKRANTAKVVGKLLSGINAFAGGWSIGTDINDGWDNARDWDLLMGKIQDLCEPAEVVRLSSKAQDYKSRYMHRYMTKTLGGVATTGAGIAAVSCTAITFGWSLSIAGVLYGINNRLDYWKNCYTQDDNKRKREIVNMINNSPNCKPMDDGSYADIPPLLTISPILDPSGFVYEGVTSNRLEGVTATVFYKENVEDMYGDLHENIVKWDAAEYAQENPLFTDENGMYAWDVPQGLWQVKFEKEGYETTYSEWLPVPPPQLDVNIAMKQNRQPEVKNARAYEDAVEVEFDKYMMPELLNTDNIIVMAGDKQVEGSIILLNEEIKAEGETESFASKLRFNAAAPFEGTEVTLMVNNRVKSYAGIRMQDNFSQSFTIEQEIRKIVCDSATVVGYGHSGFVPVTVLPASASVGKTLNVRNSSSMILGADVTNVTLDENGYANIPVSGELPGTAALTFSVDGYDLSETTIVNVEQIENVEIEAPKANIASGTTVTKGTAIIFSCATEGATIYYTLDGSCPCDEASRLTYTAPIVINETVTIKAMAVSSDMTESDIVEFTYIVDEEDGIDEVTLDTELKIYPLPVRDKLNVTAGGKTIKSVTLTSINGSTVVKATKHVTMVTLDVSSLTPGIYIINVATEDKTYSRKIMKVK